MTFFQVCVLKLVIFAKPRTKSQKAAEDNAVAILNGFLASSKKNQQDEGESFGPKGLPNLNVECELLSILFFSNSPHTAPVTEN